MPRHYRIQKVEGGSDQETKGDACTRAGFLAHDAIPLLRGTARGYKNTEPSWTLRHAEMLPDVDDEGAMMEMVVAPTSLAV